ncbi:hypothetical protein [Mameliella sp.]
MIVSLPVTSDTLTRPETLENPDPGAISAVLRRSDPTSRFANPFGRA